MKFGKQLEEYELPEWRGHYIPYKRLKSALQEIKGIPPSPLATPTQTWGRGLFGGPRRTDEPGSSQEMTREERWEVSLEKEAMRVGDFVQRGLEGLEAQLRDLEKMARNLSRKRSKELVDDVEEGGGAGENQQDVVLTNPVEMEAAKEQQELNAQKDKKDKKEKKEKKDKKEKDDSDEEEEADAEEFLELRILESMDLVAEGGRRLRSFAELNHAALYKILKKHDKLLGVKHGLETIFPRLVQQTRLGETSRFDDLDEELRRVSLLSSHAEGLALTEGSFEVARLAAGLGMSRAGPAGGAYSGARNIELVLSFFLGCSAALFLSIGVLLSLPEAHPQSYSEAYFLTPMPVFRVVFSILLVLWCLGMVARICDEQNINHMFILNVDPRCRVTPEFFFSRAAILTTLWIVIFGMYVVDYKWRVLPTVWSKYGYNERSSLHFVAYPLLLLFMTLLGMMWPSRICRNRYKTSVLRACARTAFAPLYMVDFADNMVGDIMTSLAKPLQDVPAAICYLVSDHPQPAHAVRRFFEKGDTCRYSTHHLLLPIIGGLPYVFRAFQCLRRFRDTRETRNLWNFGKYTASLAVVVISSAWYDSMTAVVIVSSFATVYAFIWDVAIDWGLGASELLGGGVRDRAMDLRGERAERQERHFLRPVYMLCILFDLLARSMWALTLMPVTIVSRSITGRVLLVSLISSIEIIRRSMWAVLRIEHEQVANASGFRALLWVPSKMNVNQTADDANGVTPMGRRPNGGMPSKNSSYSRGLRQPLLEK